MKGQEDFRLSGKTFSEITLTMNYVRRISLMQFGYFSDAAREYVITDPRTPMPLSLIHI